MEKAETMTYVYHRIAKADWQKTISYYSPDDLTQLCAKCGLNIFLDLEDHYFQGGLGYYSNNPHNLHANTYIHVCCKNRTRPYRPRQHTWRQEQ